MAEGLILIFLVFVAGPAVLIGAERVGQMRDERDHYRELARMWHSRCQEERRTRRTVSNVSQRRVK